MKEEKIHRLMASAYKLVNERFGRTLTKDQKISKTMEILDNLCVPVLKVIRDLPEKLEKPAGA